MKKVKLTKKLEFDAGHRLPNHESKCKNLHGHHYVIEITLEGDLNTQEGKSDQGMLIDFSEVKKITEEHITKPWDHAFFVYEGDNKVLQFLETIEDHKTVMTPLPPTAEHLAQLAFEKLTSVLPSHVDLVSLKLFETPTSWAEVNR